MAAARSRFVLPGIFGIAQKICIIVVEDYKEKNRDTAMKVFWGFLVHAPLIKFEAGLVAGYAALVYLHQYLFGPMPVFELSLAWIEWWLLGFIYTHFFEKWWHQHPMHERLHFGIPGLDHLCDWVKREHSIHHQYFYGETFQSRNPEYLQHITMKWYVIPGLLFVHYFTFRTFLPILTPEYTLAFWLGSMIHVFIFELTHWFTHFEGNGFDKLVARIPVLNVIRMMQILHHAIHHEIPEWNFNFNPPYLGDRWSKKFLRVWMPIWEKCFSAFDKKDVERMKQLLTIYAGA